MQVDDDSTVGLTVEEQSEVNAQNAEDTARAAPKKDDPPAAAKVDEPAKEPEPTAEERAAAALTKTAEAVGAAADRLAAAAAPPPAPAVKVEPPKEPDWDAEKADLRAKLEKGELDDDQYEDAREKLLERKADWRADARIQQRLQEQSDRQRKEAEQTEEASWTKAVSAFQADPENKAIVDSVAMSGAMNAMLQVIAREQPHLNTVGNHDKLFAAARVRTLEAFGQKAESEADKKARLAREEKARKDAAGKPPKNLDHIPAAGVATDRDNKFADLDSLDVNDLENTLGHMSEDKVREFLETAPGGLKDNPRA